MSDFWLNSGGPKWPARAGALAQAICEATVSLCVVCVRRGMNDD
jgi:hypothetical protein